MRLTSLLTGIVLLLGSTALAKKSLDVEVAAKFPDSNAFGRVVNGGSNNLINLRVTNHAGEQIVLTKVHGRFHEAGGRERLLRATTNLMLQQIVPSGQKSPIIPYKFHSENKNGEIGFRVFVDYLDSSRKSHTLEAYNGHVTVVEPETSWFDPALLVVYLILGTIFAFTARFVYETYFRPAKSANKSGAKKSAYSATPTKSSVGKATTLQASTPASSSGVENEWIPEHILRQRKQAGVKAGATSGEESEGGTAKKSRRARK